MSAELSGRFDIRRAVNGFVVREPERPVHDALKRIQSDCKDLMERWQRKAASPVATDRVAAPHVITQPVVVGFGEPIIETIPSHEPRVVRRRSVASLKHNAEKSVRHLQELLRSAISKSARLQRRVAVWWVPVLARTGSGMVQVIRAFNGTWTASVSPAVGVASEGAKRLAARLPALPGLPRRAATGIAATGLGLAVLTIAVPVSDNVPPVEPIRPVVASGPVWREIVRPLAVFNLEGGGLSGNVLHYRVNARSDGAREDVMSWVPAGKGDGSPVGVMVVHRHPPVDLTEQRLFSEIARRAASFGQSLTSAGIPNAVATKFGDLEVMDIELSGRSGTQSCLAFRHVAWSAPLALSGWRCGTAEKPMDRPGLVCFIDRLNVMSAGQELWLRDYFAESERFRSFCATKRVAAGKTPTAGKAAAAPALRGEVTGSTKPKRKAKAASSPSRKQARSAKP